MATAEPNLIFNQSVERMFQGWTVLQLAVQQGFGGQHGQEKAAWMVEAVCNWFTENDGIEPYELEDFIGALMDNEFDTRAEDGSLQVIAKNICNNFALCQSGQSRRVAESLQSIPKPDMSKCVADVSDETQDVSMEDDGSIGDHNVNAMMNGMDIGASSSSQQTVGNQSTSQQNRDSTQTNNEDTGAADDDGWTVVRRPKKK